MPCRSGPVACWQTVPPLGCATTSDAAQLRRDRPGRQCGTSSYLYRCRLRQSQSVLSQACSLSGAPGQLIAGGAGARLEPSAPRARRQTSPAPLRVLPATEPVFKGTLLRQITPESEWSRLNSSVLTATELDCKSMCAVDCGRLRALGRLVAWKRRRPLRQRDRLMRLRAIVDSSFGGRYQCRKPDKKE